MTDTKAIVKAIAIVFCVYMGTVVTNKNDGKDSG